MQKDNITLDAPRHTCKHKRTQVIAKDDNAEYVDCLNCGEVLDVHELKEKDAGFGESVRALGEIKCF